MPVEQVAKVGLAHAEHVRRRAGDADLAADDPFAARSIRRAIIRCWTLIGVGRSSRELAAGQGDRAARAQGLRKRIAWGVRVLYPWIRSAGSQR